MLNSNYFSRMLKLIVILSILFIIQIQLSSSSNWRKNFPRIFRTNKPVSTVPNLDNVSVPDPDDNQSKERSDLTKNSKSKWLSSFRKSKPVNNPVLSKVEHNSSHKIAESSNYTQITTELEKESLNISSAKGTSGNVIGKYDNRYNAVCTDVIFDIESADNRYLCEIGYKNRKNGFSECCKGIKEEVMAKDMSMAQSLCENIATTYWVYISQNDVLVDCEKKNSKNIQHGRKHRK